MEAPLLLEAVPTTAEQQGCFLTHRSVASLGALLVLQVTVALKKQFSP